MMGSAMVCQILAVFLFSVLAGLKTTTGHGIPIRWQPFGNGFIPPMRKTWFPRPPGSLRPMTNRDVLFGHTPGNCKTLMKTRSPEDFVMLPDGRAIMSTGFYTPDIGRLWYMDLNSSVKKMREFGIRGNFNRKTFTPLGMATWTDPKTGKSVLIVSNHNTKGYNCIDFFEIQSSTLIYKRSIPVFGSIKGLVMVDKDKFYMVRSSVSNDQRIVNFESSMGKDSGAILYFDGKQQYELYTGFIVPNGIAASKDGRYLYLAEYGGSSVHVFMRDPKTDFNIKPIQTVYIGTGPDRINVCPETGDLWVGAHPNHRQLQNFLLGKKLKPPSQVLRMYLDQSCGKVNSITEVYLDNGKSMSASSFGAVYKDRLFIGSMGNQFVGCDLIWAGK